MANGNIHSGGHGNVHTKISITPIYNIIPSIRPNGKPQTPGSLTYNILSKLKHVTIH